MLQPPERLDLREEDSPKIPWHGFLFGLGTLFFIQSAVITAQFFFQTVQPKVDSLYGSTCAGLLCWLWASYLRSTGRKRHRLKVAAIALAVVVAGSGLARSTADFFHNRRIENDARQWLAQAQEAAKPTWNQDDAMCWFANQGVHDARRGVGAHVSEEGSEQYDLVAGFRQIEEGGLIFQPASVEIRFIFDASSHNLKRVEHNIRPYKAAQCR
jgi:hypothetical protein